ncbi:hypothetical protein EBR66_06300 [bacterium]|nr:hypothetical protein [bacterium]
MDTLAELPVVTMNPDPQTRKRKIHCKQELIVNSLQRFYMGREDKEDIMKLLEGTSDISLRLIDWFVTNYAKQHNISYIINHQEFLVYTNYKSQLKAYSKKLFDPFCRRERIMFQIAGYPMFQTTVGKLNFFRWALEKGVLDYMKMNLEKIETAMNASSRELQKIRKAVSSVSTESSDTTSTKSSTRKRLISTVPPNSKLMQKHTYTVEVTFD